MGQNIFVRTSSFFFCYTGVGYKIKSMERIFFGFTFLIAWSIFFGSSSVYGQQIESSSTESVNDAPSTQALVVADINVADVIIQEGDDALSGTFSIQGKLGQQNDVVYGIVATSAQNALLDAVSFGEVISVREGEIKPFSFQYTFPQYLRGAVTIWLRVETVGGLPLGSRKLLEKDFGTGEESVLMCALETSPRFSCAHAAGGSLVIEYHTGVAFFESE